MEPFDFFDEPILVVDRREHRVSGANAAARRLMPDRELDGADVTELVHAEHERRRLLDALDRSSPDGSERVRVTVVDGADHPVPVRCSVRSVPAAVEPGSVLLHLEPDQPTTDRTPQVFEIRRRSVAVLDALRDAVVEIDLTNDAYVYANPRFAELTGVSLAELLGRRPPTAGISAESAAEMAALVERAGDDGPETARVMMTGPEGPFPAEMTAVRVPGLLRRWIVLTFHDLRSTEQAEAALVTAREELAIANDRERIARDLHDTVIQRLFGAGISLQSAIGTPDQDERTLKVVDDLDDVMRDIRSTIYALRDRRVLLEGLEMAVGSLVEDSGAMLGTPVRLEILGDLDLVPAAMQVDVLASLRELLANVARHARARDVGVSVSVDPHQLVLVVEDDGIGTFAAFGTSSSAGGLGLENIRRRTDRHGGRVEIRPRDGGGTTVILTLSLGLSLELSLDGP